ncbi:hypothetical protein ZWY2020_000625 [Hordeum vulgare]|nr:hypothetical protein ZWY2020_000625 [Hordeum vulgare]
MQLHVDEASALHGQEATLARADDAATTGLLKLCSVAPADILPVSNSCLGGATTDGLGHGDLSASVTQVPYLQEGAGEEQDMCMLAVAATQDTNETACAGAGSDYDAARLPVPEAAAAARGGVLASTVGAQMGSNPCAAQPHDGEVTCMHTHAATLAMLEEVTAGGCYSTTPRHNATVLPAIAATQAASVDALASAGGAQTDSALYAAPPQDNSVLVVVSMEGPVGLPRAGHKHSAGTRATGGEMDADGRKDCEAPGAAAQRSATSFGVSMQEGLQHAKASVVGTVQKAMAGREEDAAQVEATDEAEAKKKHLAG